MNFLKNLFNYLCKKPKIINKIAFLITEEYLLQHYKNIFSKLAVDDFEIILVNKFKQNKYKELINKIKSKGWNLVFKDDVLYHYKYKVFVTHMYLGGDTIVAETFITKLKITLVLILKKIGLNLFRLNNQQFLQKKIGIYNIKFMYGLDVPFKYEEYNDAYDELFCHGERDSKIFKEKFNGKIFKMGYSRYDNFFNNINNKELKENLLKKYECSPKKSTILWICTVNEFFSTILTYEKYIQMITDKYNVILRPHPIEINPDQRRFNQKVFDIVNSKKFLININPSQNMDELYLISDYVFCDYGGSIFSALYCNKNILLMNHKNVMLDVSIRETTSLEIRNYLPSINESDCNKNFPKTIDNILSSLKIVNQMKNARKIYFGDQINQNFSKLTSERLRKYLN